MYPGKKSFVTKLECFSVFNSDQLEAYLPGSEAG